MGRGPWMEQNVKLVFCGAPVSTESVPKVHELKFITNDGDLIAQWIGLRGGRGAIVAPLATVGGAHSFSNYVNQISSQMTWPRTPLISERHDVSIDRIFEREDASTRPGGSPEGMPVPTTPPPAPGFQIVNDWIRDIKLEYRVNNNGWIPHTIPLGASVPCTGTVIVRFQSSRDTWQTITCSGDGRVYTFRGDEGSVDLFQ